MENADFVEERDESDLSDEAGLSHLQDVEKLANDPEHGFIKPKKPQMIKSPHGILQTFVHRFPFAGLTFPSLFFFSTSCLFCNSKKVGVTEEGTSRSRS